MKTNFSLLRSWCYIMAMFLLVSCNSNIKDKMETTNSVKSISAVLTENNNLPINDRIALYHELKSTINDDSKIEEEMNLYGYNLLWDGKESEALEIFKLLVTEFPESANTYDSLAEVYLKTGDEENALTNYEKAFSMDSDNFNAEDQIDMIKNPDKKKLSPQEKFYKIYTEQEYKDDLDQLGETMVRVHPNALKFISQKDLSQLIEDQKALITAKTTYAEFAWICSEVIASLNCSHSNSDRFWQENQMLPNESRFPLQTRLIENKLYIINALSNSDLVSVRDEISSINGVEITDLIDKIYPHISSQGHIKTSKTHEFNMWSTGMIAFALGLPETYTVKIKGEDKTVILNSTENHNDPKRDRSKEDCGGDLCLKYLDTKKKIASMTISSFNYYEWNNLVVFQKFIDESIEEMIENDTEHLTIDLRGNGGGSPESSIHLLKYLIDEPFTYYSKVEFEGKTEKTDGEKEQIPFKSGYKGKLYFIIDGKGNSTTGHFMSIVKDRNLGTIVGEELGSNQFCSADRKRCRLSNTKLEYNLAVNTHVSTATSLPDEVGILPDHYVTQSIADYLDGKDVVKQFTTDLIRKQTSWDPASEYHSSYFLDADETLSKELFQIPLDFAPDMTLKGIEDARFMKGWRDKDGGTFWSYTFAWNVEHKQPLSIDEISHNLELYFNGLMRIKDRGKESGITESKAFFVQTQSETSLLTYKGQIATLDGFFERKPMTFNVKAEQQFCEDIQRAAIVFRFSPLSVDSDVWNQLAKVKLPKDICNE